MSIICATNLSRESLSAGTVAGALAARLNLPLVLYGVEEATDAALAASTGQGSLPLRL